MTHANLIQALYTTYLYTTNIFAGSKLREHSYEERIIPQGICIKNSTFNNNSMQ